MRKIQNYAIIIMVSVTQLSLLTGCSSDDEEATGTASIEIISTEIIGCDIQNGDDFTVGFTMSVTYPLENDEVQNFSKEMTRWAIEGNKAKLTYLKTISQVERAFLMVDAPTSASDQANYTKAVLSANGNSYDVYVQTEHTASLIANGQTDPVRITFTN